VAKTLAPAIFALLLLTAPHVGSAQSENAGQTAPATQTATPPQTPAPQPSASPQSSEPAQASAPHTSANPQSSEPAQASSTSQMSAPPLIIGSGDLVSVSIFDAPELSGRFRVDQNGNVEMPLVDSIHVAGLTAGEAAKLIEERYVHAQILVPEASRTTVFIEEYATQGITVTGEVKNPGIYPAFGVRMLNDVVTAAGGATPMASAKAIITRRNDPQHSITVTYNPSAPPSASPESQIYPGDTVMLPKAGIVYVVGNVNKAGGFVLDGRESLTAEKALALAGGTGRAPALKSTQLMRNLQGGRKVMITVRLDEILKGKAADVALQDGDIMYIPTSNGKLVTQQALTAAISIGSAVTIYKTALH
jgi:polysaccharide export outer membrane protein